MNAFVGQTFQMNQIINLNMSSNLRVLVEQDL
jgi:hypothetical protein